MDWGRRRRSIGRSCGAKSSWNCFPGQAKVTGGAGLHPAGPIVSALVGRAGEEQEAGWKPACRIQSCPTLMGVAGDYLPQIAILNREIETRAGRQLIHMGAVELLPRGIVLQLGGL